MVGVVHKFKKFAVTLVAIFLHVHAINSILRTRRSCVIYFLGFANNLSLLGAK